MKLIPFIYYISHKGIDKNSIPKRYDISLWKAFMKPVRKYLSAVIVPTIPFNNFRVTCYRILGYKIGKGTFIGMRCYLDDLCYDKIEIGENVTISYGVFFACHGHKQGHCRVVIKDGAYIGMRASIIAKRDIVIGENVMVGACSLVNKSIPDNCTAVGIPCRVVQKDLNKEIEST